jgi:hypothetical protein
MPSFTTHDGSTITVGRRLGEGSFSKVHLGTMNRADAPKYPYQVALKIERTGGSSAEGGGKQHHMQLRKEFAVYQLLRHKKGFSQVGNCVLALYWSSAAL